MHISAHRPVSFAILVIAAASLLLSAACVRADFFDNVYDGIFGDGEEQARAEDAAPTGPATTAETLQATERETLSEARLVEIIDKQNAIFEELAANPTRRSQTEYERRLRDVATQYDSYLLDNPDDIYAFLLYGKFLRTTGQNKLANNAFLKVNMLDPNIAVAKQQIGNFLVEQGDYALALPYYLAAIELEPGQPVYHYELGELLSQCRDFYIRKGVLEQEMLDHDMLEAFHKASQLAPANRDYHIRYAEAFFQVADPDWQSALNQWTILAKGVTDPLKLDLIHLQQVRVLIKMDRLDEARDILAKVDRPSLKEKRDELEAAIATATVRQ